MYQFFLNATKMTTSWVALIGIVSACGNVSTTADTLISQMQMKDQSLKNAGVQTFQNCIKVNKGAAILTKIAKKKVDIASEIISKIDTKEGAAILNAMEKKIVENILKSDKIEVNHAKAILMSSQWKSDTQICKIVEEKPICVNEKKNFYEAIKEIKDINKIEKVIEYGLKCERFTHKQSNGFFTRLTNIKSTLSKGVISETLSQITYNLANTLIKDENLTMDKLNALFSLLTGEKIDFAKFNKQQKINKKSPSKK